MTSGDLSMEPELHIESAGGPVTRTGKVPIQTKHKNKEGKLGEARDKGGTNAETGDFDSDEFFGEDEDEDEETEGDSDQAQ